MSQFIGKIIAFSSNKNFQFESLTLILRGKEKHTVKAEETYTKLIIYTAFVIKSIKYGRAGGI